MRIAKTVAVLTLMVAAAECASGAEDDADFAAQGEYVSGDGGGEQWGVQVIALGDGKFTATAYRGGLPGDGWDKEAKSQAEGQREGAAVVLSLAEAPINLVVENGELAVVTEDGEEMAVMEKVERKSPTLGAKPPEGAVVLFDGKTAEHFKEGEMTEDGLLKAGGTSKQNFRDFTVHMEFQLPFTPKERGQDRANSGFYVQGRYEVQVLDSFGLEGEWNECGGIYKIAKPDVNMCFPPGAWQTYDVDFTAAVFEDGKKVENARITVRHNGVAIHADRELPNVTAAKILDESPEPGPIYLQDHDNPVLYRNIWVVER